MSGIQAKTVLKYAILPGIIPRLKALFGSGFGYIAYLMAHIYAMVRLLPQNHTYLNPQNIGLYGIRNVIAEAANNLVISKKNIDQLVIFILMLTCITLLALQLFAVAVSLLLGTAMATQIFVTTNPDTDIAFMLLDQVFGAGTFFNSCVSNPGVLCPDQTASPPYPWPFHAALHNMFEFYSRGILIIGALIFLYFVVVVVVETATTGTPFGQRFQNVWVPIRLVVAIGLLLPLGFGYNSGQYITFFAAKYGSSLATNAWLLYNRAIQAEMGNTGNPMGERENLIAMPKPPEAAVIAESMSIIHSCAFAYYLYSQSGVNWPDSQANIPGYLSYLDAIKPYFAKTPSNWQTAQGDLGAAEFLELNGGTTYKQAYDFYSAGDIVIRFGRRGGIDADGIDGISDDERQRFSNHSAQIEPTCGEIRIPITEKREIDDNGNHQPRAGETNAGYLGSADVQKFYFELIRNLWFDTSGDNIGYNEDYIDFAGRFVLLEYSKNLEVDSPCNMGCTNPNPNLPTQGCDNPTDPESSCARDDITARWKQNAINKLQTQINTEIQRIWVAYNTNTLEFNIDSEILDRGWAGAGIWFNKIAQVNGGFINALLNYPSLEKYPLIMEKTRELRKNHDNSVIGINQFNPSINPKKNATIQIEKIFSNPASRPIAITLSGVFNYWHKDNENQGKPDKALTAGALEMGMNLVFGTYGLFAMTDENVNIHPLAQLVALGKGLVESSVRNVVGSTMSAALGGAAKALDVHGGSLLGAASGFLSSTAFIGLTAGFVLYYILPFLPFVYFYFAVASWIKTIFEAMVGVPLWALAHLRLDGEGLPGESASNGYFLILEIFIRPTLAVAGLIAAIIIFTAQVRVLNFTWALVTENVGGHNSDATIGVIGNINFKRSIIDEFFYTVLYAIIVYLLATTAFKLVDKIPESILRWSGQGISSFGDMNQDPTEGLTRYAALGGMTAGRQAVDGVKDFSSGIGGAVGRAVS